MEAATLFGSISDTAQSRMTAAKSDQDVTHVGTALPIAPVTDEAFESGRPFVLHTTSVKEQNTSTDHGEGPRLRSSRTWKLTAIETMCERENRKKPLGLLELPVDILKEIIKEVTHTNDLTALALCHSALHKLSIPYIYSRFDIVWPDSNTHSEPRSGVDALTYGLATLVMAEEIFGEAPHQQRSGRNRFLAAGQVYATETMLRKRRGNHYAQYTKKFSLGNGPADWVQEYLITKEGGKMLGTLVALAVARMQSLETFVWDMPTGVLRDVWLALSSLADHEDVRPCRLQKVWVRWHDNSSAHTMQPLMPSAIPHIIPTSLSSTNTRLPRPSLEGQVKVGDFDHIEHPSFSVLPPLSSLSVLDIDELAYLDEMAVLIRKSVTRLRELRVGIARHAATREWIATSEETGPRQVDHERPGARSPKIGQKRYGGVLGVLTGRVLDMRENKPLTEQYRPSNIKSDLKQDVSQQQGEASVVDGASSSSRSRKQSNGECAQHLRSSLIPSNVQSHDSINTRWDDPSVRTALQTKLRLETLELERIPLSINVLQETLDWTMLTCLTLLDCRNHETLWRCLSRVFSPVPKPLNHLDESQRHSVSTNKSTGWTRGVTASYQLNLKRIHTNNISQALMTFLKETLAPNSLEVLFLQNDNYAPAVSIHSIFRGPLRRHRSSLKKLLIDSSVKSEESVSTSSERSRRWMVDREVLTFILSGKMPKLRELGVAIDYRDWQLPSVPHLRSVYMPFLHDHVHGSDLDPRELALQILDVVALRPEVELCYLGIANKCFEILETKSECRSRPESTLAQDAHAVASDAEIYEDEDDQELVDHASDADAEDHDGLQDDETESEDFQLDTGSESDEYDDNDDMAEQTNKIRLRLREILFYDDKVAIFQARHGRL